MKSRPWRGVSASNTSARYFLGRLCKTRAQYSPLLAPNAGSSARFASASSWSAWSALNCRLKRMALGSGSLFSWGHGYTFGPFVGRGALEADIWESWDSGATWKPSPSSYPERFLSPNWTRLATAGPENDDGLLVFETRFRETGEALDHRLHLAGGLRLARRRQTRIGYRFALFELQLDLCFLRSVLVLVLVPDFDRHIGGPAGALARGGSCQPRSRWYLRESKLGWMRLRISA